NTGPDCSDHACDGLSSIRVYGGGLLDTCILGADAFSHALYYIPCSAQRLGANAFTSLKDLVGVFQGCDYIDVFFDDWSLVAAHAASIDFGDTAVMEKLLAAGADLKTKNKQGLTALDLARNYNHANMVSLLTGKIARWTD